MKVFSSDRKSEVKDKRDHYYNNSLVNWLSQNYDSKICISSTLGRNNWWAGFIFLCLCGLSLIFSICFNCSISNFDKIDIEHYLQWNGVSFV